MQMQVRIGKVTNNKQSAGKEEGMHNEYKGHRDTSSHPNRFRKDRRDKFEHVIHFCSLRSRKKIFDYRLSSCPYKQKCYDQQTKLNNLSTMKNTKDKTKKKIILTPFPFISHTHFLDEL